MDNTGMDDDAALAAYRWAFSLALGITTRERDEDVAAITAEQERRSLAQMLIRNRNREGAEHD